MASDAVEKSKQPAHQKQKTSKKVKYLQSIGWIVTFVILAFYADFISSVVTLDYSRVSVLAAGSGTLIFLSCFFYITIYSPYFLHVVIDLGKWEQQAPRTIQMATFGLVLSRYPFLISKFIFTFWYSVAWNFALWPVYGWTTPLILFLLMMALISVFSFL
jgi:hypothetical protein